MLRLNNGFLQMRVNDGTSEISTTAAVPLPTNSWHHVAGTFDNSVSRVYQDGVLVGQQGGSVGPPFPNTNTILQIASAIDDPWSGYIDNVRLWSIARTQQQIQSTMNYVVAGVPDLVSSWNLDGNFQDSTGANHGAMVGVIPFALGAPLFPYLAAPTGSPIGVPLALQINNATGGVPYILDISVAGTSPGVTVFPGVVIPLNPPLLNHDTGGVLTSVFVNFSGVLDGAGHAFPFVNVPWIPELVGLTISAMYVTIDFSLPTFVSFIAPPTNTLLVAAAPTISSLVPPSGPTTGGTTITINGTGFQPGAWVVIGTTPVPGAVVQSPTAMTFVLPQGGLGPKAVTVTNPDGTLATVPAGFSYSSPMLLGQASPLVAAPGATVVVPGSGIQSGATLSVGGIPVIPTTLTANQVSFLNPPGVACGGPIQVTNPDTQAVSIPFNPTPSINTLSPAAGPAAGGNNVLIFGVSFFPGSTVQVDGNTVPSTYVGQSLISMTMPPASPGTAQVRVTSANGCPSQTKTYTYQ